MVKRLDPEFKAMRALVRATNDLEPEAEKRVLEWFVAYRTGRPWVDLPALVERTATR